MKVQVKVQNNHQYQQTKMYSHKSKFSASIQFLLNKISEQTERKVYYLVLCQKKYLQCIHEQPIEQTRLGRPESQGTQKY